jgi:hypothetical protein
MRTVLHREGGTFERNLYKFRLPIQSNRRLSDIHSMHQVLPLYNELPTNKIPTALRNDSLPCCLSEWCTRFLRLTHKNKITVWPVSSSTRWCFTSIRSDTLSGLKISYNVVLIIFKYISTIKVIRTILHTAALIFCFQDRNRLLGGRYIVTPLQGSSQQITHI